MGIDAFFDGHFTITPPVSEAFRDEINGEANTHYGRSLFDPWEINDERDAIIGPDEGRRAYDADENLVALVNKLILMGHTVAGTCKAVNDEDAYWKYVVTDGEVNIYGGFIAYTDGTTEYTDWECRRRGVVWNSTDAEGIKALTIEHEKTKERKTLTPAQFKGFMDNLAMKHDPNYCSWKIMFTEMASPD